MTELLLVTHAAALLLGLRLGYRAAVRRNGRDMIRTGTRRLVKGRW